eukprot:scaffold120282_cov31-Tisochrysis_lutea.AAC.4
MAWSCARRRALGGDWRSGKTCTAYTTGTESCRRMLEDQSERQTAPAHPDLGARRSWPPELEASHTAATLAHCIARSGA